MFNDKIKHKYLNYELVLAFNECDQNHIPI